MNVSMFEVGENRGWSQEESEMGEVSESLEMI